MELKNSTNQMVGLFNVDDPLVPRDTSQPLNYDVTSKRGNFQQSLSCNNGMMNSTGLIKGSDLFSNLNYQVKLSFSLQVFKCI